MSITPQTVLQQARQGNPDAIAALMNQHLQARGITAQVTQQGDALHVCLEATQALAQEELVAYIKKGITGLSLSHIHQLQVSGKQIGHSAADWTERIPFQAASGDGDNSPEPAFDAIFSPTAEPLEQGEPSMNGHGANSDLDFDLDNFESAAGFDDLDLNQPNSTDDGLEFDLDAALGDTDIAGTDDLADLSFDTDDFGSVDADLAELDLAMGNASVESAHDFDLDLDPDALQETSDELDAALSDLDLSEFPQVDHNWTNADATDTDLGLDLEADLGLVGEDAAAATDAADLDFGLDLESTGEAPDFLDFTTNEPASEDGDLSFDLDTPAAAAHGTAEEIDLGSDLDDTAGVAEDAEFDLHLETESPAAETSDLDLDFDSPSSPAGAADFDLDFDSPETPAGAADLDLDFETQESPAATDLDLDLDSSAGITEILETNFDQNLDFGSDPEASNEPLEGLDFTRIDDENLDLDLNPEATSVLEDLTLDSQPGLPATEDQSLTLGEGLEGDLWGGEASKNNFDPAFQSPKDAEPVDLMLSEDLDFAEDDLGTELETFEPMADEPGPFDPPSSEAAFDQSQDSSLGGGLGVTAAAASQSPVHKLLREDTFPSPEAQPSTDALNPEELAAPEEALTPTELDALAAEGSGTVPDFTAPEVLTDTDISFDAESAAFDTIDPDLDLGDSGQGAELTEADALADIDPDLNIETDFPLEASDELSDDFPLEDAAPADEFSFEDNAAPADDFPLEAPTPADEFSFEAAAADEGITPDDEFSFEDNTEPADDFPLEDTAIADDFSLEGSAEVPDHKDTLMENAGPSATSAVGLRPEDFPIFNSQATEMDGADAGWSDQAGSAPEAAREDSPLEATGVDTFELDGGSAANPMEDLTPEDSSAMDDEFLVDEDEPLGATDPTPDFPVQAAAHPHGDPEPSDNFMDDLVDGNEANGFVADTDGEWRDAEPADAADEFIEEITGGPDAPVSTSVNLTEEDLDNLDSTPKGSSTNWLVGLGLGVVVLGLVGILFNALVNNRQPGEPVAEPPTEIPVPVEGEPVTPEPEATEPEATEPEATEPEATEPEATEPEATEPEATEPEATEPEATEPEAESEPEPAAEPPVEAQYFRDAVNAAQNAANLAQTASTGAEWQTVADSWAQAIELMKQVPESDPNYATAQQKAVDYQPNLEYAQQNAE